MSPDRGLRAKRPSVPAASAPPGAAATVAPSDLPIGIGLALAAVVWVGSGLLGRGGLWGLGALHDLPPAARWPLAALALAGFVPPVGRGIHAGLERLGRGWERGGWIADLCACGAVFVVLFVLRDSLRFTGDFAMRVGLIDMPPAGSARLMRYAFPLDEAINLGIPRLLVGLGLAPPIALQVVGATVGSAYACASIAVVRALGARGAAFAAGALLMLTPGTLVHFAGYDKFGPLMLGLALATLGAVRLWRRGRGLVALATGVALAVLSHRSGYLLIPAAGWMLMRALRARPAGAGRFAPAVAAVVVLAAALAMLPHTIELAAQLDLPTHLPGGAVSHGRESSSVPGAAARVANGLSALSFLVPLWPAGLGAAILLARRARGGRERAQVPIAIAAGLAFGLYGAMVLAVTPGGGWPRDWDVALGWAAVASLIGGACLVAAWSREPAPAAMARAVPLALASALVLWTIHAHGATGLRRIDALLAEPSLWSASTRANACDLLGAQEFNAGRLDRAAWYFERAIESAPNPRFFHQLGIVRLGQGRNAEAATEFRRAIERNPRVADPWAGLARVALASADSAGARALADSALARSPRHVEARAIRQALGGARP